MTVLVLLFLLSSHRQEGYYNPEAEGAGYVLQHCHLFFLHPPTPDVVYFQLVPGNPLTHKASFSIILNLHHFPLPLFRISDPSAILKLSTHAPRCCYLPLPSAPYPPRYCDVLCYGATSVLVRNPAHNLPPCHLFYLPALNLPSYLIHTIISASLWHYFSSWIFDAYPPAATISIISPTIPLVIICQVVTPPSASAILPTRSARL